MDRKSYLRIIKRLRRLRDGLQEKKSADYATVDVLSNFKRIAKVVDAIGLDITTPTGYALFMALMKIDRINNILTCNKDPQNESIEDSFMDLSNYVELAYACSIKPGAIHEIEDSEL